MNNKLTHGQRMKMYRSAGNIVLIDFDGTLAEFNYPRMGPPIAGARDFLHAVKDRGLDVVVWSSRLSPQYRTQSERQEMGHQMGNWMRRNAMPFDDIDIGDFGKRLSLAYIDDRGVGAGMDTPWENVLGNLDRIHNRELARWQND